MSSRTQRRQRLIAVLALVLLTLIGAIIATRWADGRSDSDNGFLADTIDSEAHRLRMERPERDAIVMTRAADTWQVEEPCRILADARRLESLLDALASASLDYPAMDVDREAAGLLQPEARVFIDEEEVLLGGTDLSGERRYAQRGDRVALLPEWVLSLVNGGLSALASRELFPNPPVALEIDGKPVENVAPWLALAATQIIDWPIEDAPPETHRASLLARLSGDEEIRLTLVANASWTALISVDDGACARLFASDDIPVLP